MLSALGQDMNMICASVQKRDSEKNMGIFLTLKGCPVPWACLKYLCKDQDSGHIPSTPSAFLQKPRASILLLASRASCSQVSTCLRTCHRGEKCLHAFCFLLLSQDLEPSTSTGSAQFAPCSAVPFLCMRFSKLSEAMPLPPGTAP